MTETLPPEKVREIWHKARKFIGMSDDDVVYQGVTEDPNAFRRLNADVAAAPLPPVVDKDFTELARAEFDKNNCGDRFE